VAAAVVGQLNQQQQEREEEKGRMPQQQLVKG
jgi:hypothetical protein